MKNKLLIAVVLLVCIRVSAQTENGIVKLLNPPALAKPNGYSHVAEIDLGTCRMLILSGQVALDREGNLSGKDDLSKQTDQVFQNIQSIVTHSGGTMNDVVKLSYYIRDVSQIKKVREVRDRYINIQNPPASTLVEVSKLFREDILIEIEATVIISKK